MAATPSPSPEAEEVSIGSVLDGRYRIDAVLGAGGMGRVFRGEHTGIGRAVAIKVLHADLGRNREATARFQREALASGRLDHPNIVGVSDFGVLDDGACYLVMEALDGESLGQRIEREHRLHWREAVAIMRGMLSGLAHAHDRGVVHRDIKPDNVFLARKEQDIVVKILDFGIAKLAAGSGEDPAATRAGLTVGTPAYLSPEQAVGGEITPASDLYSATIVLFEMLAGRTPFHEKEPLAMLGAHVSRTPPRVHEVAPAAELPPGLEELIQHGLVKTSADRIASAAEYIAALDNIAGIVQPYAANVLSGPTPIPFYASSVPGSIAAMQSGATPMPGSIAAMQSGATPMPGSIAAMQSGATPMPHSITPIPGSLAPMPPVSGAAPTALLEASSAEPTVSRQQAAVSLPTAPLIPKRWLKTGLILLGIFLVLAILYGMTSDEKPAASTLGPDTKLVDPKKPGDTKPTKPAQKPEAKAIEPILPAPPPQEDPAERETKLKAAIHDLQTGKTCPIRKAAVERLRELGDPKAIPALRRAKYRMRGGVLGIGSSNTNGCLVKDADAAIKALSPPK